MIILASRVIKDKIESTLNDKQKQFCREYLKDLNATQAYKRVYECDDDSANANGNRLIVNDSVKLYLNQLLDEYKDNVDIEVAEIVNGLKDIVLDETSRKSDKIKAYELLGRWKQMFIEKKEITVNTNKPELSEEEINKQLKALGYIADEKSN